MTKSPACDFLSPLALMNPPVITPSGWLEHGPFAAWLIEATRPSLFVELGTHWGYSFFAMCEAVKTVGLDTRCVAIDTWEGDEHAGFYTGDVHDFVQSTLTDRYQGIATMMRMRFDQAVGHFEDGSIDLLHIDGRHRYEDAVEDFDSYLSKLSKQGVVIMHDIAERAQGFGVWRHWAELTQRYPTFEFRHGHGLGVVAIGSEVPETIRHLTGLLVDSPEATAVRSLYEKLGRAVSGTDALRRADEFEAAFLDAKARHEREMTSMERQASGRAVTLLGDLRRAQQENVSARRLTRGLMKTLVRERLRREGERLVGSDGPDDLTTHQLSVLFDPDHYRAQHPELAPGAATFEHYMDHGWPADESPTPLFDPDWYLAVNPDVAAAGLPALAHYLVYGEREGRSPNAVFDPSWYRLHHGDDFEADDLALVRFVSDGRSLGHDPSPAFHTRWYLDQYPEVADSGEIALSDYLRRGALLGRNPHPDFDTAWYVASNPDICRDGTNPLVHYLTYGLDEGRATSPAGAHHCRH